MSPGQRFRGDFRVTVNEQEEWQGAGLTTARGNLERPVDSGLLQIPSRIELHDGFLWWDWLGEHNWMAERAPSAGLLWQFVALATVSDHDVLAYARRWGVLLICEHGLPGHVGNCELLGYAREFRGKELIRDHFHPWAMVCEPIATWRFYAVQARAILTVAARLHEGRVPTPDEWAPIFMSFGLRELPAGMNWSGEVTPLKCQPPSRGLGKEPPWWDQSVDFDRVQLAKVLNNWLAVAHVRFSISWGTPSQPGPPNVGVCGTSLFSAIAIQLVLAVARVAGFAVCSGCGSPVPRHAPPPRQSAPLVWPRRMPTCAQSRQTTRQATARSRAVVVGSRSLRRRSGF